MSHTPSLLQQLHAEKAFRARRFRGVAMLVRVAREVAGAIGAWAAACAPGEASVRFATARVGRAVVLASLLMERVKSGWFFRRRARAMKALKGWGEEEEDEEDENYDEDEDDDEFGAWGGGLLPRPLMRQPEERVRAERFAGKFWDRPVEEIARDICAMLRVGASIDHWMDEALGVSGKLAEIETLLARDVVAAPVAALAAPCGAGAGAEVAVGGCSKNDG